MELTSIVAIYFLVWIATAFVMLPFGVRTADEVGQDKVPGQAESAPVNFRPGRLAMRATAISAVLTGIYILNYEQGWITASDIDVMPEPPAELQR